MEGFPLRVGSKFALLPLGLRILPLHLGSAWKNLNEAVGRENSEGVGVRTALGVAVWPGDRAVRGDVGVVAAAYLF